MSRYLIFPLLALAVVACGQGSGPSSLTGPSLTGGSTAMVGDAQNSCSSDAPGSFRITSGEPVGERWKNLVQFEPVAHLMQYYIELNRRTSPGDVSVPYGSWSLTVHDMSSRLVNFEQYDLPDGVYSARIRSFCGNTPQGNWSDYVVFTNGYGSFGPDMPPPPPPVTPPQEPPSDPCEFLTRHGILPPGCEEGEGTEGIFRH